MRRYKSRIAPAPGARRATEFAQVPFYFICHCATAVRMLPEMAYAQRAAVRVGDLPKDMVWLNANENPAGPPAASLAAMREALPTSGRYHYQAVSYTHLTLPTKR